MKINFKAFKTPAEVKEALQNLLPLGTSTPDNILEFLDGLGLKHSQLLDNSRWVHKVFAHDSDPEIKPSQYEEHITSMVRARPTLFVFANAWMLYFHFNAGKLAEIEVELASQGL